MSIRQQIVDAVETRFRLIREGAILTIPLTGYDHTCGTSIGERVYPWRKTAVDSEQETPCICFYDLEADTAEVADLTDEHRLRMRAEIFLSSGTGTAAHSRRALADIIAAIGSDLKWGGLARWTEITGHSLGIEHEGKIISIVGVDFSIVYRTPFFEI